MKDDEYEDLLAVAIRSIARLNKTGNPIDRAIAETAIAMAKDRAGITFSEDGYR